LKILVTTGIFPPDIGGPAAYVPGIAASLTARGYDVTVVTLSDRTDHDDAAYPFRVVRLRRSELKLLRTIRALFAIMKLGWPAHLLFANGLAPETALAGRLLRKPMVIKVVGDAAWERAVRWGWVRDSFEEFQTGSYGLKIRVLKAMRTWWTKQACRVIAPSRFLARWVSKWGIEESRIVVIHNAVELTAGAPPFSIPLRTEANIATIGRLTPWKHVDRIIGAVSQLDGVGLVIIGDGPERRRLETLAAGMGISDRVYFTGTQDRGRAYALMAACKLLVLSSSYEGLPHVILEAMHLGLPVVTPPVGGIPEIVSDGYNGRLVPLQDGEALCKEILSLMENPSERLRLAQGAKQTSERFSFRSMVEKTDALLRLASRRP
jgi:glycosyltransferase involved in cell wall biosynthesis